MKCVCRHEGATPGGGARRLPPTDFATRCRLGAPALLLAGLACGGTAPPQASDSMAELALYRGADRSQRLLQGARREGELLLYTSLPVDDATPLVQAFEALHGVRVNLWRAQSYSVRQRILTEAQAGRFDFDVVETNGLELEALHLEKLLQRVHSPHLEAISARVRAAHQEWAPTRLNVFVQAYNTNLVQRPELPSRYHDLVDPRWRDRIGIESGDPEWFAAVVQELGEEAGLELFRKLVTQNGLSVRTGHTLLLNLVASGEIPLALTAYHWTVEKAKQQGAPVDWFVISPPVARPNGVAVSRKAPHPNAALLFYDFMLSEGRSILRQRYRLPTSEEMGDSFHGQEMAFVNVRRFLEESEKWIQLFDEIVVRQQGD